MGGSKGGSAPPTLVLPGPTPEETAIQQQQLELMKKQTQYMDTYFNNSESDRVKMQESLDLLTKGRDLTDSEKTLIDQLGTQYKDMLLSGITDGIVKEQLDNTRNESMADLVERGVLDGTTGQRVLGDIEKERSRLIAEATGDAALQRLQLERDFRKDATNAELARSQILSGVSGQLGQLAGQAGNSASGIGADLSSRLRDERISQFNVSRDNAMSRYAYDQQRRGGNKSGVGSLIGGTVGAIGGAFARNPFAGYAIGSTLGGGVGSMF